MTPKPVVERLTEALGPAGVLTGERLAARATADWSNAPAVRPSALLLPGTPEAVARALSICHQHQQPVVVQGGLTGLAGGANPCDGEIALSLARLDAIEDFDAEGGTVVVQAGVTLEHLQTTVAAAGWAFPLDLGARGSCQLGGNAATNAGGNMVLRYGTMRHLVLGLEVALADGRLLTMLDRVVKNTAGFDLKQLFIGSEGALGVITRLSLKLEPLRAATCTALCAVPDFTRASALLRKAKASLPELSAFELMWPDFMDAAVRARHGRLPLQATGGLYALVEARDTDAERAEAAVERVMAEAIEDGVVDDAVVAKSVAQAGELWGLREAVSELLALAKPCAAFDVSVPMPRMEPLVDELRAMLMQAYPGRMHLFFGHLGDGNLHLISGPYPEPADLEQVEERVYAAVGRHGGSISGEHGVGVVKRDFLHHSRSPAEMALMAQLKRLFDPAGILNRGRVIDSLASAARAGA